MLQQENELKDRQLQKGDSGGDLMPGGGALGFQLLAFVGRDRAEAQLLTADVQNVAGRDFKAAWAGLRVLDPDAALGEDVIDAPAALVAPAQDGVHAADAGRDDAHVGVERAADDVLPVGEGVIRLSVAKVSPDLGLVAVAEHGTDAADDQYDRCQDQNIFAGREAVFRQGIRNLTPRAALLNMPTITVLLLYHSCARIDN